MGSEMCIRDRVSVCHKGSTHDSLAFQETEFSVLLQRFKDFLVAGGFFLIGDSAYNLLSYFLVPFENPQPNSMYDDYNFWHSNSRIRVECACGEFVMHWGIFWRTLRFSLRSTLLIIEAAMLLHNFIIDERLRKRREGETDGNADSDRLYFSNFNTETMFEEEPLGGSSGVGGASRENPNGGITDNNENRPAGRLSEMERCEREEGVALRNRLTERLVLAGFAPNVTFNPVGNPIFS